MKTYIQKELPNHCEIIDQSENYLMVIWRLGVIQLRDAEMFLQVGLEICGVTPGAEFWQVSVLLRKRM